MAEQGGGMNAEDLDLNDMFGSMFGGGGRQKKKEIKRRNQIVQKIKVSLEDLFKGVTKEVEVERQINCRTCEGYVMSLYTYFCFVS